MPRVIIVALVFVFLAQGFSQTGKTSRGLSDYKLIDLQVAGATAFPREKLMAEFPIKIGEKADMARIKKGIDRVKQLFQEAGYLDFAYTPFIDIDREAKTVSCSYDLSQGKQYFIRRLDFVGSSALSDRAARSALSKLGLEEGKIFRISLLDEAVKALNKMLGSEQLTTNSYEYKKLTDSPGAVDVTILLQPDKN